MATTTSTPTAAVSNRAALAAVIATGGKQYLVHEGDELLIERRPEGKTVSFTPLAVTKGGALQGARAPKVTATVLGPAKGPKLTIFKMRPKQGSRTKAGHRQALTRVRITAISV
jgi:large subunit ribosomal protein L21